MASEWSKIVGCCVISWLQSCKHLMKHEISECKPKTIACLSWVDNLKIKNLTFKSSLLLLKSTWLLKCNINFKKTVRNFKATLAPLLNFLCTPSPSKKAQGNKPMEFRLQNLSSNWLMKYEAWKINSQMTEAHVYKRTSNLKNPKIIKKCSTWCYWF